MKICIPSKNRSEILSTHLFFNPDDVIIFVEPDEYEKYKYFNPDYKIVDIGQIDQGICYVKNFIIGYAQGDKIIIADDDITFFGIRNNNYRYDILYDTSELVKDVSSNLDRYAACSIPNVGRAYFVNKTTNNTVRYMEKNASLINFVGINTNKLKNIKYDKTLIEREDTDFTIQLMINNLRYSVDYKYSIKAQFRTDGGFEKFRNVNILSNDMAERKGVERIIKKYGPEFLTISHDKNGYIVSLRINYNLIKQRPEIIKQNIEKYYKTVL